MTDNFIPILLITLTIALIVILFIIVSYVLIRVRSLEAMQSDAESTPAGPAPKSKTGGALSGFRGKAIWDALENPGTHPGVIAQLSSRYAFVLARHIEQVIDQGQLDRQRNREAVPESDAAVGGLRGEVHSWLPSSYVQRFYRIGSQSVTVPDEDLPELRAEVHGLVDEILHRLHMTDQGSGISQLVTSHTLDFRSQARGEEYEASVAEANEAPSNEQKS